MLVDIQIGMFRPIRVDHTNCLQVAIKTHSFIYVCEDRGWYYDCLVALVGGHLQAYFFLWYDRNSMENKGVSVDARIRT
jgi:hypothetical protein